MQPLIVWPTIYTIVSQKKAHYGLSTHSPVLPRFPAKVIAHLAQALQIGIFHCLASLNLWVRLTVQSANYAATVVYTSAGHTHHFECFVLHNINWWLKCRPTPPPPIWAQGKMPMSPFSWHYCNIIISMIWSIITYYHLVINLMSYTTHFCLGWWTVHWEASWCQLVWRFQGWHKRNISSGICTNRWRYFAHGYTVIRIAK